MTISLRIVIKRSTYFLSFQPGRNELRIFTRLSIISAPFREDRVILKASFTINGLFEDTHVESSAPVKSKKAMGFDDPWPFDQARYPDLSAWVPTLKVRVIQPIHPFFAQVHFSHRACLSNTTRYICQNSSDTIQNTRHIFLRKNMRIVELILPRSCLRKIPVLRIPSDYYYSKCCMEARS